MDNVPAGKSEDANAAEQVSDIMRQISQKHAQRQRLINRLDQIQEYVALYDKEKGDIHELMVRHAQLPDLWNKFDNIIIDGEQQILTDEIQRKFETKYYATVAAYRRFCEESVGRLDPLPSSKPAEHALASTVKIPRINLTKFSGDYHEWTTFKEMFTACILDNKQLTEVQQFYYLKSVLEREALEVIQHVPVTAGNLNTAWRALCERYENSNIIINSHIKSIVEQAPATGSVQTLRTFCSTTKQNLRALKNLNVPIDGWDTILIYLLSQKLDKQTRREWELYRARHASNNSCERFFSFIEKRCAALELLPDSRKGYEDIKKNQSKNTTTSQRIAHTHVARPPQKSSSPVKQCDLCKNGQHRLYQCSTFLKMDVPDRLKYVETSNHCKICLKLGCKATECKFRPCPVCNNKHNSLLHTTENISPAPISNIVNTSYSCQNSRVLLSTAQIYILAHNGVRYPVRALLDSGSEVSLIKKSVVKQLGLVPTERNIKICGIGKTATNASASVSVTIQSRVSSYSRTLQCLIMDNITGLIPSQYLNVNHLHIPKYVQLADPTFNVPQEADVLLGADVFFEILQAGQLTGHNQVTLYNSVLGWIVTGRIEIQTDDNVPQSSTLHVMKASVADIDLHHQLTAFWELEEMTDTSPLTAEQEQCEKLFSSTTIRDEKGRYIVQLPLREDSTELGDSLTGATQRWLQTEKRLTRNQDLAKQYVDFMDEYLALGHMTKVNPPIDGQLTYYLPHHAVLKPDHLTTKCRVVFDASFKSSTRKSLNDLLMVGPVVQQDLMSIILRFRLYKYVVTADITKMYRQILIDKKHRDLQRIVWRRSPHEELQHYQLNTVTYGTASAPYQATKTLQRLAQDDGHKYNLAKGVLQRDFYMDDLLTGGNDLQEMQALQSELLALLEDGGFELRKWRSNNALLLTTPALTSKEDSSYTFISQDNNTVKTLGLLWQPSDDTFQLNIQLDDSAATKRSVLSTIARIYDPLGMVAPVIVKAKIYMQSLWKLNLTWDDTLPKDIKLSWLNFKCKLVCLNELTVNRQVCNNVVWKNVQLHGFSDASEVAYGAAIYVRAEGANGEVAVDLLCAKSRVAPLKKVSLPRLELCGALLLARLLQKVRGSLERPIDGIYCWSDSKITLAWIAAAPGKWKTFVANRVAEIQNLSSQSIWQHVVSEDNPADHVSRGCNPDQLAELTQWWHGPAWLQEPSVEWPSAVTGQPEDQELIAEEAIKVTSFHSHESTTSDLVNKYSWPKLIRITAYLLRFIKNCSANKSNKNLSFLTNVELQGAIQVWCRQAQAETYSQEISDLRNNKPLHCKSKILSLHPFIDEAGLLRVGGRLKNANLPLHHCHQILLPASHKITELIANHFHLTHLHVGPQTLLAIIRQRYWPVQGKALVNKCVRRCVTCFRAKPTSTAPLMGQLPAARVIPARPFLKCGVDFCGPVLLRQSHNRKSAVVKAYIAIFVCMVTKAVHIELVSDLTTDAFLAALRRMMSRRGKCAELYSDNATNFTGAHRKLCEIHKLLSSNLTQSELASKLLPDVIKWSFIPANSPTFGGLWERAVQSVKYHTKRVIGSSVLTFEELATLLQQIEACLNSRPLAAMSNNPNDPNALTPAHFLIGDSLLLPPEPDLSEVPQNRLKRWELVRAMAQHIWRRWSTEYLHQLQQRPKWNKETPPIQVNDLVLIREDNLPPMCWAMGRVVQTIPGPDRIVRVAIVKTARGEVKRAILKLCKLPIE